MSFSNRKTTIWLLLAMMLLSFQLVSAGGKKNYQQTVEKFIAGFSLSSSARLKLLVTSTEDEPDPVAFPFNLSEPDDNCPPHFPLSLLEYSRLAKPRPRWGRAGLELAAMMSYSQARYWIRYSRFIEDWQYHLTWEDQRLRFFTTEALRFDSNAFYLNWTHALAGMLYYEFARSNNLSWLQSTIFSVGGSLYWEYFVEWREIISINDNIMTAVGGIPLGESWFQMGRYFLNSKNPVGRLLSWLNPYLKLNGWLDRKRPLPPYHYHYNPSVQDVYLFVGYRSSPVSDNPAKNTGNLALSLHSRIIIDSSYGLPGRIDEKFFSPFYSQLDFDFTYHGSLREELSANARIVPLGRVLQNISEDKKGYSLYYGLGSAFYLFIKRPVTEYDAGHIPVDKPEEFHFEIPRDFRDKVAAVHLIGPVAEVAWYSGPWKIRLKGEAYPSFGMINSLPLNSFSVNNDIQGMKTTVKFYGYHYGFGPALESLAEITCGHLRLTGFSRYSYYRSLQGRDRFQSWLTDDSPLTDSWWHYGLSLDFRIPRTLLTLTGSIEGLSRWGRIHELEEKTLEKRYHLGLKYRI